MRPVLSALVLVALSSTLRAAPPANLDDAPLRTVRFADKNEGWAAGDHGCIWHTIDGGKTWERQPTGTTASLRGLHFLTPYLGFAVGRTELPRGAGSAGIVLTTADGGATWTEMTSGLLPGLDAVRFSDEKVGIVVGSPSNAFPTGAFRTDDGGKSWKPIGRDEARLTSGTAKAKWATPIHDTFLLEGGLGWAVGDLGTILHTTDGGTSWHVQRCGGQRAAVLFAHARPEAVPFGVIALLGAKDGYLCVAECESGSSDQLATAVRAVGGAAGSCWSPANASIEAPAGAEPDVLKMPLDPERLRAMVRCIRVWRPEVIITDEVSATAPQADRLMLLHMKEAFTLAADPKAFPELGPAPHAAKKLYALAPASGDGIALDLTAFHPALGDCAKDFAEHATMLLDGRQWDAAHFRLIAHRLPGAEKHTSLMEGIDLAEGGMARRKAAAGTATAEHEKSAATRRRIEAMTADSTLDAETLLTRMLGAIRDLPDDVAARTAVATGFRLVERGQWTVARELFALTAENYAGYPEAVEAVRWLIRFQASGEVRRRLELGHQPILLKAAFAAEASEIQPVGHVEAFAPKTAFRFRSAEALRQWNQAALDLEPKLAAFGGVYSLDPTTAMPLIAARRNLGLTAHATNLAKQFAPTLDAVPNSPWRSRMADERRILERAAGAMANPTAECRATATKPFLDGKLDDACWKAAPEVRLPGDQGYATTARFAFDESFLYVALTCNHPAGKQVPKAESRSRDADLTGHDRVELLLDLDRDYQTYYRLRVDHRGCVAEDCWGDTTWNPRWFVAVEPSETGWTAELAIPLSELTGLNPTAGAVWAMNLVRVVPGVGPQSWGGPSGATARPESMGLMRFVAEPARR